MVDFALSRSRKRADPLLPLCDIRFSVIDNSDPRQDQWHREDRGERRDAQHGGVGI